MPKITDTEAEGGVSLDFTVGDNTITLAPGESNDVAEGDISAKVAAAEDEGGD